MVKDKFYVSTPLYYVNGELHIGGAYTTIVADMLARYHRARGKDVFFLTGSDEHGQKIYREAQKRDMSPKEFSDEIVQKFHELWQELDITHDHFIRTTDENHEQAVQALFRRLRDNGDIYLGKYEGYYCTQCEAYVKDADFEACPECGRVPEKISEENYFFRLSKYQKPLLDHIDANEEFILPLYRRNEVRHRVAEGLDDLSVSRSSFDWGVRVPDDEKHIIYVWVDALMNYITALGAPDDPEGKLERYWPADVHLIGKDIIWFHCVIWPALLMSLGFELPKTVFAHGWWTIDGNKISKSKGNIIYPREVYEKYGRDALRYFLVREVPFGRDGDFSFSALDSRYHQELGNDLGNLLMRTASMIGKYFDGEVPEPLGDDPQADEIRGMCEQLEGNIARHVDVFEISLAIEEAWKVVRETNRFVEHSAPWKLAKSDEPADRDKLATVLYTLAEACRIMLVNLYPFLPDSAPMGLDQLGQDFDESALHEVSCWGVLKPGTKVTKGKPLFPRIED